MFETTKPYVDIYMYGQPSNMWISWGYRRDIIAQVTTFYMDVSENAKYPPTIALSENNQ
jgi:hypothetical protein